MNRITAVRERGAARAAKSACAGTGHFARLVAAGIMLGVLVGCSAGPATFEETRSLMGTYISITVVETERNRAEQAIDKAFSEIRRLEHILSIWQEDTEISLLNRTAQRVPVQVSEEIRRLTETSLEVAARTDGAFDPTIGPLVALWKITKRKVPPSDEEVLQARRQVDYRKVDLEGDRVKINGEGTTFDFGGIAKGYAADRAVAVLKQEGIRAGIVSVAGDIRVFGGADRGTPWKLGIQNPRGPGLIARLLMDDGCISTSGDYERYFEYEGRRYHHIIDPRTGYPAAGARSVSVLGTESVYCDGLATGFFVLGPDAGLARMNEQGIAGLIVGSDGKLRMSRALETGYRIELTGSDPP